MTPPRATAEVRGRGGHRRIGPVGRAALVLAAVAVQVAPASADVGVGSAGFVACDPGKLGHCVRGVMTTRVYPTGVGLVLVEFTCVVTGTPDPVSTAIDQCAFNGAFAVPVPATSPGPALVQEGAALVPVGGTYTQCIAGTAHFAEGLLGAVSVSGAGCATTEVIPTQ